MTSISFDFALTSYCQSRCKTCPRTNRETGEPEDWLVIRHVPFDKFKKNTLGFTALGAGTAWQPAEEGRRI